MLNIRWLYHVACRAYFGTMVRNGCPDRAVVVAYLRHCAAVNEIDRRLSL